MFNKIPPRLLFIILALGLFASCLRAFDDFDLWYQLLAGARAISQGSVPHSEFFTYPEFGSPQSFGGWGFGALMGAALDAFGVAGPILLNASLWFGAMALALFAAMARAGRDLDWRSMPTLSIALAILSFAMGSRMAFRAESTLVLAISASFALFEWARLRGKPLAFVVGFPLIAWAQAQFHTGGFVLLALLALFAARSPAGFIRPGAACALLLASAALPLANPNGPFQFYSQLQALWDALFQQASNLSAPAQSAGMANLEYLPFWDPRVSGSWLRFLALYFIMAATLARPRSGSRRAWAIETLVLLAFCAMAALFNRGIALAAIALAPAFLEAALARNSIPFQLTKPQDFANRPRALALLALSACAFGSAWLAPWSQDPSALFNSGRNPSSLALAQAMPDGARIFSNENGYRIAYELGADRYRISSISHLLIDRPAARAHYLALTEPRDDWREQLDQYDVQAVCLPLYEARPAQGRFYALTAKLSKEPSWLFIPVDGGSCDLFIRRNAAITDPEQVLAQRFLYLARLSKLAFDASERFGDERALTISNAAKTQALSLRAASAPAIVSPP